MTQINLLPWREQARQAKKLHFLYMAVSAIGIAIFLVILLHLYFNSLVHYQNRRNIFLQSELEREQNELTQMNEEKKQKTTDEETLRSLFVMRKSGYQIVSLLDQVAKSIPDGILLNSITRKSKKITIIGRATSNIQITLFIQSLSASGLFKQPELSEISAKELGSGEEHLFQLKIELRE